MWKWCHSLFMCMNFVSVPLFILKIHMLVVNNQSYLFWLPFLVNTYSMLFFFVFSSKKLLLVYKHTKNPKIQIEICFCLWFQRSWNKTLIAFTLYKVISELDLLRSSEKTFMWFSKQFCENIFLCSCSYCYKILVLWKIKICPHTRFMA